MFQLAVDNRPTRTVPVLIETPRATKGSRPRMLFDMETLPPQDRYKILAASVVPRPIAWITTKSRVGIVNAAPLAMNVTCIDAPRDVDELQLAQLTAVPSRSIAPPRIGESPVSFECRMLSCLITGPLQTIVIGRVVCAHVADRFVLDARRCHLDTPALRLVARMHGSGGYLRSTDQFELQRPTWAEWQARGT